MQGQDAPFAVQIELVEGCTLACDFCGINGIREKPGGFKYMKHETLDRIATEIAGTMGWNPRIEFAMHGEPSQHPAAEELIGLVRRRLPEVSIMMTSNGSGFQGSRISRIDELFRRGLNVLALDDYEGVKFVPYIREAYAGDVEQSDYPLFTESNPHRRRKPHDREIVYIEDISQAKEGSHSNLNTHCGAGMPPETLQARCAKPFRELSFRWDGNVALCCNDFRGEYPVASIHDMSLHDLWNHIRFKAARKYLYHGLRDFNPCDKCNAKSQRVGLLPDKKGQQELLYPDYIDQKVVNEPREPLSPIVLRTWEIARG